MIPMGHMGEIIPYALFDDTVYMDGGSRRNRAGGG